MAFGPKPESLVRDLVNIAESILPPKPAELWQHRGVGLDLLRLGTKNTTRSPVTQVVDRPARLDQLPVLTTWQEDGGPFIHVATRLHRKSGDEETQPGRLSDAGILTPAPRVYIGRFKKAVGSITGKLNV